MVPPALAPSASGGEDLITEHDDTAEPGGDGGDSTGIGLSCSEGVRCCEFCRIGDENDRCFEGVTIGFRLGALVSELNTAGDEGSNLLRLDILKEPA